MNIYRIALSVGLAGWLAIAADPSQSRAQTATSHPVVVELFTSQGCHSCPPADALVGELSKREDVIALAYHVDYWDYIGWKDPFASPQFTERQRRYGKAMSLRTIYTPQMVIDGTHDVVGSRRLQVKRLIEKQAKANAAHWVSIPARIKREANGDLVVEVSGGDAPETADIWLVAFDNRHDTPVPHALGLQRGARLLAFGRMVRGQSRGTHCRRRSGCPGGPGRGAVAGA